MAATTGELETRLDILEREVGGEKVVTRYILEQSRHNGDDLAVLKTRVARVEDKVDGVTRDLAGLRAEVGALRTDTHGLQESLPRIVADTMREVLAERDAKR